MTVDAQIRHPLYARFYARLAAAEEKTAVADHRRGRAVASPE